MIDLDNFPEYLRNDKLGEGCETFTVKIDFPINQGSTDCDTIKQTIDDTRR